MLHGRESRAGNLEQAACKHLTLLLPGHKLLALWLLQPLCACFGPPKFHILNIKSSTLLEPEALGRTPICRTNVLEKLE